MCQNEAAVKHVVNVQVKVVGTLLELQSTLSAQQTMLGEIMRSLAPLSSLKSEMLDAMQEKH